MPICFTHRIAKRALIALLLFAQLGLVNAQPVWKAFNSMQLEAVFNVGDFPCVQLNASEFNHNGLHDCCFCHGHHHQAALLPVVATFELEFVPPSFTQQTIPFYLSISASLLYRPPIFSV